MKKQSNFPEQHARVQAVMRERDLDVMLAISLENVYWLTEALILTQRSIPDRLAIAACVRGEDPVFLVCGIEESLVVEDSWIPDVKTYEEFAQSPIAAIADILRSRGLAKARIGLEKKYLCAYYFEELARECPGARLEDVSLDFEKLRMIKTPREIDILRRAAFDTEKAMVTSFAESKTGDPERSVLNRMIIKTLEAGGDGAKGSFGTGPKSAIAHPFADESPLKRGDIVSVDFGASFKGYMSDIGRTAVVGSSSQKQERIYGALYDVQRRLIDMVRPGVKACDIYRKALELTKKAGIALSLPHVGHGIGLAIHEEPLLSPFNEQPLAENMMINIEPFYVTDEGYHAEDTMIVRRDGVEIVSTFRDHGSIIPIR